jgi:hypothetical protein
MTTAFNDNFRNLFLIIAKSASQDKECPLPYQMIKLYIDKVFTEENDSTNRRLFSKYSTKVDEVLKSEGSSLNEAISNKDRSIFRMTSIIPEDMIPEYKQYAGWFSLYLENRMPGKHMDMVFRYIKALKNQL